MNPLRFEGHLDTATCRTELAFQSEEQEVFRQSGYRCRPYAVYNQISIHQIEGYLP